MPGLWQPVVHNFDKAGWLVFVRSADGLLGISPDALSSVSDYVQDRSATPEAGGVLLGRRLLDCNDVAVDEITRPQPGDSRSRYQFFRRRSGHQQAVDKAWTDSGGSSIYVGEWHSHPEPSPSASTVDLRTWAEKTTSDVTGDGLFFIIVGIDEIAVWEGAPGMTKPVQLRPREET